MALFGIQALQAMSHSLSLTLYDSEEVVTQS